MKLVNRDMTRECVTIYTKGNQIYAEIWSKTSQKWKIETYFKDYGFPVDKELISSTVRYIKRIWGLKNPKVIVN